jgi:hypothetical protein
MVKSIRVLGSVASGVLTSFWAAGALAQSAPPQAAPAGPTQAQVAPPVTGTTLPMAPPTSAQSSSSAPPAAFANVQVVGQPQTPPSQTGAPVVAAADGSQPAPGDGQWVYLADQGWTWVPGGASATAVNDQPYVYVYTPSGGWNWLASPWGWGPYYYGPWALGYGPGFWGGYYHYGAFGGWHGGYGGGYRGGWGGGYHGGAWGGAGRAGGYGHGGGPVGAPHTWGGSGGARGVHPHYSSPHSTFSRGGGHGSFGGGGHFGGHGGGGGGHGGGHR